MTITPRELEDRFEEAALTLRRLPNPPGSGPKGYGNAWPEYIRDAKHAYGYHEARMRVTPSPRDIQRMEECLEWLSLVDPEAARIIWLRAERVRWRQVCIRMGCVRSTAWRRWAAALVTIAKQLNRNGKPARKPAAPHYTTVALAEDGGGDFWMAPARERRVFRSLAKPSPPLAWPSVV